MVLSGELQPEQLLAPSAEMLHASGEVWDCPVQQGGSGCSGRCQRRLPISCCEVWPHMQWGYTGRRVLQSL